MSEMVPCVLGKGGRESSGALDAEVRYRSHYGQDHRPGVSLGRGKRLLDDRQSTNDTYGLILIVRTLEGFQRIATAVGNNGESVRDGILDAGNDGVGIRDIMTNCRICVYYKCLLGTGS